jgi:hypothetical protein
MTGFPHELQINAWPGSAANTASFDPSFKQKLLAGGLAVPDGTLGLAPPLANPADWRHPEVGWGVVLPDRPELSIADRAVGADAPDVLRSLVASRKGAFLRFRADRMLGTIRRYYQDGSEQDIAFAQAWGTARGSIPRYLLIYGAPSVIPWSFQFELQNSCFTGRLDIEGLALERYVEALEGEWAGSAAQGNHVLIWAADHGAGDITRLMRNAIAAPLNDRFAGNPAFATHFIDGKTVPASGAALKAVLDDHRPIFIASTSHGATGPLASVAAMQAGLGQLIDSNFQQVTAGQLTSDWQPDGAVWYAHACCSAGSVAQTAFDGLVPKNSDVDRILNGVAACGDMVAPFPRALLSLPRPIRAFVGHVEPTFDWSIRHSRTGQYLTIPLLTSFYNSLFNDQPIGMALDSCRRMSSSLLHSIYATEVANLVGGADSAGDVLATRLMAHDWRAFVLLGDPTCTIT